MKYHWMNRGSINPMLKPIREELFIKIREEISKHKELDKREVLFIISILRSTYVQEYEKEVNNEFKV